MRKKRILALLMAMVMTLSLAATPAHAVNVSILPQSSDADISVQSDESDDEAEKEKEKEKEREEEAKRKEEEEKKKAEEEAKRKEEEEKKKAEEEEAKRKEEEEKKKAEEEQAKKEEEEKKEQSDSSSSPSKEDSSASSSSSGSDSSSSASSAEESTDSADSSSAGDSSATASNGADSSVSGDTSTDKTSTPETTPEASSDIKTEAVDTTTKEEDEKKTEDTKKDEEDEKETAGTVKPSKKHIKQISDESFQEVQTVTAAHFSDYSNSTKKATGAAVTYQRLITLEVKDLKQGGSAEVARTNLAVIESVMSQIKEYNKDESYKNTMFKVVIPEGTYYLDGTFSETESRCIHLYSNTWLSMKGVTLIKLDKINRASLRTGRSTDEVSGYEGESNIIVEGGTWEINANSYKNMSTKHFSSLRFGHDKNVILANVRVNGAVSGHHVELCGVDGASIVGCMFTDYVDSGYVKGINRNEAIQIDYTNSTNITPTFKKFDSTLSRNIVIYQNTFEGLSRGVGSHSAGYGKYYDNIVIQGNTFEGITYQAIYCQNYRNSAITGNYICNSQGGIEFNALTFAPDGNYYVNSVGGLPDYSKVKTYDAKTVIENNSISLYAVSKLTNASGIYVHGGVYNGTNSTIKKKYGDKTFYISGVSIQNNTITSARDAGIYLDYVSGYKVKGNRVSGIISGKAAKGNGVYLNHCKSGRVEQNTIFSTASHALYLTNTKGSKDNRVALVKNTITATRKGNIGIYLKKCSYVNIGGCNVQSKSYAVYCSGDSHVYIGAKSQFNTLSSHAKYSVYISGKSKKDMTVSYNHLLSTSKAVSVAKSSKATVTKNSFQKRK